MRFRLMQVSLCVYIYIFVRVKLEEKVEYGQAANRIAVPDTVDQQQNEVASTVSAPTIYQNYTDKNRTGPCQ
jgi:hypothetical protein